MLPLVENETDENSLRLFAPVSPFFAECAIASLCEKRTRFLRVSMLLFGARSFVIIVTLPVIQS